MACATAKHGLWRRWSQKQGELRRWRTPSAIRSDHLPQLPLPVGGPGGSDAPNKWSTFSIVNKSSYLHISMTKGVQRKNSSDLSLGRRPVSKSEEFFLWTTLVIEIPTSTFFTFPKKVYTLSEHHSPPGLLGLTSSAATRLRCRPRDRTTGSRARDSW